MRNFLRLTIILALLNSCSKETDTNLPERQYQPDGLYFDGLIGEDYYLINDSIPNNIYHSSSLDKNWRTDSFLLKHICTYPLNDNKKLRIEYYVFDNLENLDTNNNNYLFFKNMISEGRQRYLYENKDIPLNGFNVVLIDSDSTIYWAANAEFDFDTAFVFNIADITLKDYVDHKDYNWEEILFSGNLKCDMICNLTPKDTITIKNAKIKAKFTQGYY